MLHQELPASLCFPQAEETPLPQPSPGTDLASEHRPRALQTTPQRQYLEHQFFPEHQDREGSQGLLLLGHPPLASWPSPPKSPQQCRASCQPDLGDPSPAVAFPQR
uniref:Uncharacterized protein n=1 Tax=uncultured marine virus TaxID=186617 RepID=A0A0F7L6T7_9VIRU|nr:hypothetical protein [uncultured marine virus]